MANAWTGYWSQGSQDSAWWQTQNPDSRGAASAASGHSEGPWWPQSTLLAWPPLPPPNNPPTQTAPLPPPNTPPETPTTTAPPTTSARVPIPSQFKEDSEHYDTNLVFKSTLRKNVEPTAWSRAKGLAGMDVRDVTLQKKLRESNIDVDATIEAIYKDKNEKAPDKVKEATAFVTPLVDVIFEAMKPWAQVRNYAVKNPDNDNQAAQRMQALEEQAGRSSRGNHQAAIATQPEAQTPHQSSQKRNEDILPQCYTGREPPSSMTSIATWVTALKKGLPRDKHAEIDAHIQSMQTILENAKHTKAELQEMATRWGLPLSLTTAPKASPKNLQQLIAAVTYLAVNWSRKPMVSFQNINNRIFDIHPLLLLDNYSKSYEEEYKGNEATHPSLQQVLWNRKRKVTDMGHMVTGLETLQLPTTHKAFHNVGAGNDFFSSKQRIQRQYQEQMQRWLKHHQFPRDQRTIDEFDEFFEQEWKQHKLQLQQEPRITHRLAKNILAMIPEDYIVHNEDHANAHLMIYCPNVYNQAAYNTWMDQQTFRMLDKDPEDIKQDMKNKTPKAVAKHYTKLLAYEKPLPHGYILMKRKKRWAKGRTIIAYSNTCIGKLLKIAALALQQMLRITWPNHFGDVSSPQLWEEIHQLFNNNEHMYPERHLKFLNHDLVGFFNSIPQSDILQSIHFLTSQFLDDHNSTITVDPHNKVAPAHSGKSTYSVKSNMVKVQAEHIPAIIQFSFDACAFTAIGQVFQQTCGTSMGNQISPILSTCAIVATEITWLRMYGQFVSSAHLQDKFWIRRYVDNRFRIHADDRRITYNLHRELDDLYGDLGFAHLLEKGQSYACSSGAMVGSRVKKCKKPRAIATGDERVLTDIDTDSEVTEYKVRLPHGLPLDMTAPICPTTKDDPVEQECEHLLRQRYIPFEVFPWPSTKLNSEFLRASALTRAGRQAKAYTVGTYYHAGSIGVRTNTRQRPWTAATLAYTVRACTHTPFSTVSLLCNIHMRTHRDKYNKPGSLNVVIPVSNFRQGHLWIQEDDGPDLSPNGQHRGRNIELKLPGVEFDPFMLHGTCPWKSDRLVLSAYTTNRIEDICKEDKEYRKQLGFNLP
ncbi:unnamed protein product [Symbiodinium sp. CCMP2592]|nr:unnamed protein product [Symbiodinium sp. CCMP2592]